MELARCLPGLWINLPKWELYLASLQLSHFLTRPEIMAATANVATQQLYW